MINSIINKVKHFFSDQNITWVILVCAVGSRIIQLIYFYNIRVDASYQVMATQNLVFGHGITTAFVLPSNLSTTIYEPLINWPPGYSLLLAPFYILYNHNYIAAGLTLDILFVIIFIFTSRNILKILNVPLYLINIYTLLTSFFVYYFYIIASSDSIVITAFILALYFTLLLLKKNQNWEIKTVGIIFLLCICAITKYLFIPVVFIIPLFLVLKGFTDNQLQIKKAGIYSFLILTIAIAGLLIFQKYISGSSTYISSTGRGFFLENLLSAYPFIPGSFVKPDTLALLFHQKPSIEKVVFDIFQWIHILLLFFFLIYTLQMFYTHGFKKISVTGDFFYLFFFTSLTITILLMILSVRVSKEEIMPGYLWTYIQEPRYYGLPTVLIHMAVFAFYPYAYLKRSRVLKYVFYFFLLLLIPEMFRGIIFDFRRLINFRKEEYSWQYENRFQKYAEAIIIKEKQKKHVTRIVITGPSYYMNNRVCIYSYVPILNDVHKINNLSSLNTKTPLLLLIILHQNDFPNFQPFLSSNLKELAGYYNGFSFYTIYVTPH